MQQRPVLDILCIHVYYEPFAKFAIGNDMEAAKVMCCRLRHSPQKAQNEFLDFVSCRSDGPFCVFVPFVAIKLQTANGFSVTSSLTDWGGKTLDLKKPRPSPRPGSNGKDARALLRPGPCGSLRHGGRVRHRGETERQPKGEDAGGTPALPGGPLSSRLPFEGESAQTNWLDGRLESRFDNPLVAFVVLRGSLFFFCFR